MIKTFGLLGEKLGHSYSPLIHSYLGEYKYLLFEISSDSLDKFMLDKNFDGVNVTIPYKQAVIPYCSSLSDEAQTIGSVNTIIKQKNGSLHGYNTDHHGFNEMLKHSNINPTGKKVLVLGDGGAARTVRVVLDELKAKEIITISRRGENHYGNFTQHYNAEIIINTTPVGMYPDNGNSPINLEAFKNLEGVADLIYNPMRTKLLLEAEKLGVPCINGLTMLVAQAEMASRLFTGEQARPDIVTKIIDEIYKKTKNIALIGMPGCGKSTVGESLALKMGRPFADIDTLIEITAGKSIPDIFTENGEETFRQLETQALIKESKKSNMVIATGGGIVTRPENLDLLRQNSFIIYLKRDLAGLNINGRPLSQGIGVETLANQRLPLYEAWSDLTIDAQTGSAQTAEKILEVIQ